MRYEWLGVEKGHHELSHEPDSNEDVQKQLTRINKWYCEQMAYLAKRLAETPEPGGNGSLLDNTTIMWTNELGKGNSHTPDNVPFVLVGGGLDFKMGRSLKYKRVAHNRRGRRVQQEPDLLCLGQQRRKDRNNYDKHDEYSAQIHG